MDLLNKDTNSRCKINASIYLNAYEEYLLSYLNSQKKNYLQNAK